MIKDLRIFYFNNFIYPDLINNNFDLKRSIGLYSKEHYKIINSYLRGNVVPEDIILYNELIRNIDLVLEIYSNYIKDYNLEKIIHVKRKIYVPLDKLDVFKLNLNTGIYSDKAFMSTSLINHFKIPYNVLLDINVSNLLGAYISTLSSQKNECEFLIKRDTIFNIEDVITDNSTNNQKLIIKLKNK